MKSLFLLPFLFLCAVVLQGQTDNSIENIVITSNKSKTQVVTNESGELNVNVSPKDVAKFKANGFVRYSDLGALGDGKTDDIKMHCSNPCIC